MPDSVHRGRWLANRLLNLSGKQTLFALDRNLWRRFDSNADAIAMALKGVGKSKAAAIVAYREQYGHFKSADQLLEVKGIGKSTLEKNRNRIEL